MKKRIMPLLALTLALGLFLCACGGPRSGGPGADPNADPKSVRLDGGTWTAEEGREFNMEDYASEHAVRSVPVAWVLPEEMPFLGATIPREVITVPNGGARVEVKNDFLLYAYYDGVSEQEGLMVVRYQGEGQVELIYQFADGAAVRWQPFFSADGSRIAFPWRKSPAEQWNLRVVDLPSGKGEDLTLPDWDGQMDYLFAAWQEDGALRVAAAPETFGTEMGQPATWVYHFPG